jgi:NAD(P)-dependent dehydrogenase (short-subunit alcohol dehydrogenase family)
VTRRLEGRTIAVIGASSGIGNGVARRSIERGAVVFAAARRIALLGDLVTQAGSGRALECDVVQEDAGCRFADEVRLTSNHLDALFISAGSAPLRRLEKTSVDEWRVALETNVIGINRIVAGSLQLLRPTSVVVIVSSETATVPRSHLGAYGASKAALEHSIRQWREEHPWLRVTGVSLGATLPTEFGRNFESDETMRALEAWSASGHNQQAFMDTEEVSEVLIDMMTTLLEAPTVGLHRLELRSPSPVASDLDFLQHMDEAP